MRISDWSSDVCSSDLLAPLGRAAMNALTAMPGERILDIGCGSGQTSLELGGAVEPGGEVLGIDLSAPLLEVAQRRNSGHQGLRFVQGDAQVFPFAPASFDAAFSRFGVMFFADPVAAFLNIRRGLKPGGRLAFACWRSLEENPTRSEEHTSELQSLMRISYAVFCLKKKKQQ